MKLSIVFQGSLSHIKTRPQQDSFKRNLTFLKEKNPGCEIIISTWEGEKSSYLNPLVNKIIYSKDPGPLPGLKFDNKLNNVNRLIVSSCAGVAAARGEYIVKLRTDLEFYMEDIVGFYENETNKYGQLEPDVFSKKMICTNLFTIDPRFIERMPYHISDWIQIGFSPDLKKYWNIKNYELDDALYYNFNKHNKGSNEFEIQFQSRYAAEQYLTVSGCRNFGHEIPLRNHNDFDDKKISEFYSFLSHNYIIRDTSSLKLINEKYRPILKSVLYKLICINESRFEKIYTYVLKDSKFDYYGKSLSFLINQVLLLKKINNRIRFALYIIKRVFN